MCKVLDATLKMLWLRVVTALMLFSVACLSQTITSPPQSTTVSEGGNATFNCMAENGGSSLTIAWQFTPSGSSVPVTLVTGTSLNGITMVTVSDGLRTQLTFSGVRREANGGTVVCLGVAPIPPTSNPATLTVQYSPQFFPATDTATPTERQLFTYSFSIDANPPATNDNIALTKNDVTVTDTRFTVNATSLTIADVIRDDSGVYQITASNVAGSGSSTVTVDVYYFEDLSLVPRSADLTEFGSLTVSINIDANPTPNVTLNRMSGRVMIIGNSILFQSVDRADGGRYVVTADNGVDVKTAEFTLTVYTGGIITGIVLGCLLGLIIMAAAPVVMVVLIVKRNSIKAAFNAKKT